MDRWIKNLLGALAAAGIAAVVGLLWQLDKRVVALEVGLQGVGEDIQRLTAAIEKQAAASDQRLAAVIAAIEVQRLSGPTIADTPAPENEKPPG